jgi:hypothetical protein
MADMMSEAKKSELAAIEAAKIGDVGSQTPPPVSENGVIASAADFEAETKRFKSMLGVN